jgi:hypothetical protein
VVCILGLAPRADPQQFRARRRIGVRK